MDSRRVARRRPCTLRRAAAVGCSTAALAAGFTFLAGAATADVAAVVGPTQAWVTDGDVLTLAAVGGAT